MQLKEKKKAAVLAVLVAGLVIYWAYSFFQGRDAGLKGVPSPARKAAVPPFRTSAVKVDVDLLNRVVEPYRTSKNIFAPIYKKPVLEKPHTKKTGNAAITVTPLPPLPPPPPPKSQEEIDAENAREEMKKVKVLGFLKRKNRVDVFLSFGNSNYIVGKGDVITKEYYLEDMAKDYVTVSDKKTGVKVKVPADFTEKKTKNVPFPGLGKAGSSSPTYQQPAPGKGGVMPTPGRPNVAPQPPISPPPALGNQSL